MPDNPVVAVSQETEPTRLGVYISHAQDDQLIADLIAEALGRRQITAATNFRLEPRQDFETGVLRVLETCAAAIAIVSPKSLTSNWVTNVEWPLFVRTGWERDSWFVIPVIVDQTPLPPFLRSWQAIHWTGSASAEEIASAVANLLELPSTSRGETRRNESSELLEENALRFHQLKAEIDRDAESETLHERHFNS